MTVAGEIAEALATLPTALGSVTRSLGPDLAKAIADPALRRGARDLLQSNEVAEGVDSVAWRVGAIVGGCVLGALVLGALAGRALR